MSDTDKTVETQDNEFDGLTAGERVYLESGGQNADGLRAEQPAEQKTDAAAAAPAKKDAAAVAAEATSAAAEPAAKEPVADEDDDEGETTLAADGKTRAIPYQKYSRERKKMREQMAAMETANRDLNERFTRGDERAKMLAELVQQTQPEEPKADPAVEDPEPDPNQDIIAWANWSRRENGRLRAGMEQTREAVAQTRDTFAESAADQKVREDYQSDAVSFAREHSDFVPAYNHLLAVRAAMLQDQGRTESDIRVILRNEEKGLVQGAFEQNKRPAELIYSMAKRLGWQTPAARAPAPAAAAAAPPTASNGAAQPAQAAQPAKPNVTEEIERIQKGQAASRSLSGVGGAAQELSVEALANMSDAEFQSMYATKKTQIEALLGGRN